jgi:hypothetical protein
MAGNQSIRAVLWQLLLTKLDLIAVGSGYWTTPTILEFDPPDPNATGSYVVCRIGDDVVDEVSVGKRYTMVWTIVLDCYTEKTASTAATNIFNLTQDVRRAVGVFAAAAEELYTNRITVGGGEMAEGVLGEVDGLVSGREVIEVMYITKDAW